MNNFNYFNIHKNEKAFIIGTGPSLKDTPVKNINKHIVIGVNGSYKKENLLHTYYVSGDKSFERTFAEDIKSLKCKAKFCRYLKSKDIINMKYDDSGENDVFATEYFFHYMSVTNVALQLSFKMGCNPVYLIGIDHCYDFAGDKSKRGKRIVLAEDINHFTPYKKIGSLVIYNFFIIEKGYKEAYRRFTDDGRVLRNASLKTALSEEIIPRISFEDCF